MAHHGPVWSSAWLTMVRCGALKPETPKHQGGIGAAKLISRRSGTLIRFEFLYNAPCSDAGPKASGQQGGPESEGLCFAAAI